MCLHSAAGHFLDSPQCRLYIFSSFTRSDELVSDLKLFCPADFSGTGVLKKTARLQVGGRGPWHVGNSPQRAGKAGPHGPALGKALRWE